MQNNISYKDPPLRNLPIIQKLISAYKLWQEFLTHFPKTSRSLGFKIDNLFLEITELFFIAGYLNKEQKTRYLNRASIKFDLLKFFMQMSWEIKILDNKKYIVLSEKLSEIGKMLGGWKKSIENKTSAI